MREEFNLLQGRGRGGGGANFEAEQMDVTWTFGEREYVGV